MMASDQDVNIAPAGNDAGNAPKTGGPRGKRGLSIAALVVLFLVNVGTMQDMVILPAANEIIEAFPDASINAINFILTGPMLLACITQLGAGFLMQRFTKKSLLIVFWSVFTVSSIFGATVDNIVYIMVMRAISGLSIGGLIPLAVALITQQYPDSVRRSKIIGYFFAAMAAVGAVESLAGGYLATISWQDAYLFYWIAVPVLLGLIIFIPSTPEGVETSGPEEGATEENEDDILGSKETLPHPWASSIANGLSAMIASLVYGIIVFQAALVIAEIGAGASMEGGIASAIGTVTTAIIGVIFGFVLAKVGRAMPILIYAFIAVGLLVLFVNPDLMTFYASIVIMGIGYGFVMPYFSARASAISIATDNPVHISVTTVLESVGTASSSFVATFLMGLLGVHTRVELIPVLVGLLVVACVLSAILFARYKRQARAVAERNASNKRSTRN